MLTLILLLGAVLRDDAVMTVRAERAGTFSSGADPDSAFSIEAEALPSDRGTYNVRLTVENRGEDWEGTVRVIVEEQYWKPCAYDTALSLPQGSRKQFVVSIPMNSISSSTNGTVNVALLDRKGEETAKQRFNRLLEGELEALSMGILSDAYGKLTYLDAGGEELYFYDEFYPVRLVELQQGALADALDALTFLVIDQYNTGILTAEEMDAIESWNLDGGVLIIGTGAFGEDTLAGFDGSYLEVRCREIYTPEEMSEFGMSESEMPDGVPNTHHVDWSQLTVAEMDGVDYMYVEDYIGGWVMPSEDGSVCVLPYSLTELAGVDESFWEASYTHYGPDSFASVLLNTASEYANARYTSTLSYSGNSSYIQDILIAMGNSNSVLNFGVLKGIVIVYVIFVGPVLYLILRFLKRREFYWAAVPVTALLGIVLVFLAGRDFEVVSTKAYSVTMQNLSDSRDRGTYLYCYDAGRREWELRLAEGVSYAGPLETYYGGLDDGSYYYHIAKEGEIFSVGIKPGTNFEDSFFYLKNAADNIAVDGSFLTQDVSVDWNGVSGTIMNDTNQDMAYFAVFSDGSLYVFENLLAGASCRLEDTVPLFEKTDYYPSAYIYRFLDSVYTDGDYRKFSALSALGVGVTDLIGQTRGNDMFIIGVVEDWDKTVDDNCTEVSYGCFYMVQ